MGGDLNLNLNQNLNKNVNGDNYENRVRWVFPSDSKWHSLEAVSPWRSFLERSKRGGQPSRGEWVRSGLEVGFAPPPCEVETLGATVRGARACD